MREGREGLGASRADASGGASTPRGRPRRFDTLVDELRLDLGPRVSFGDSRTDRRAQQNIWHFDIVVDSGRRSFSHSSMRCLVLYNTSTRSHASPPTTAAPVSGAQLCFRYRRIARLVRIVSFRSNRFFSAPK